ncbi:MAG: VOC family protein [Pseudonocardiaceae bacterium]
MAQRTSYTQGTPNWVDLQTTDQDAAKAFYGQLFGWRYDDMPMPQGSVYSMAVQDDGFVAAIAPQSPELAAQGVPPTWYCYLAVDDVDAAAALVEPAGGKLLMAPFDVMEAGRMTVALDPTGAAVALWQADQHIGATRVGDPGAMVWHELRTGDEAAAVAFYRQVLGLTTGTMDFGEGAYTVFTSGEDPVAGVTAAPAGVPSHWHVYFAVEDAYDAARRASELGGTVVTEPMDTPIGAMAMLRDPQGGAFSIFAPNPATDTGDTIE